MSNKHQIGDPKQTVRYTSIISGNISKLEMRTVE